MSNRFDCMISDIIALLFSLLVNNVANVQVVAKYLGHTKVEETLKTYSHLFTSTLDEVVAVIVNLDNNKTDD